MDMKSYPGALALLLALGAGQPAMAQMYRCQQADQAVSYQQTPCAAPELPQAPAVPPRPPLPANPKRAASAAPAVAAASSAAAAPGGAAAAASASPTAPAAPSGLAARAVSAARAMLAAPGTAGAPNDEPYEKLTRRMREVLDLTARFDRCRMEPEFAARTGEVYQAWRRRHAATLSEYRRLLAIKVRAAGRGDPPVCSDDWVKEIELLARAPDPRFATVEQTWELFVRALQAADRTTVMACVTGPVAQAMRERLDRLADADLRRMGVNIRALKVQWGDDYDKEGMVVHGDRVDTIAFRSINEEWKIRLLAPASASGHQAMPKRSSPDS